MLSWIRSYLLQGSWPGRAMWCKKRLLKAHSQQKSYYILRIILRQVISIWIYLFFLFSGTKLDRNWSFLGSELLFIARISHAHLVVLAAHISRPMVHMPSCFQILASHPLAHNLWLVNMVCWNYMFHSAHPPKREVPLLRLPNKFCNAALCIRHFEK